MARLAFQMDSTRMRVRDGFDEAQADACTLCFAPQLAPEAVELLKDPAVFRVRDAAALVGDGDLP